MLEENSKRIPLMVYDCPPVRTYEPIKRGDGYVEVDWTLASCHAGRDGVIGKEPRAERAVPTPAGHRGDADGGADEWWTLDDFKARACPPLVPLDFNNESVFSAFMRARCVYPNDEVVGYRRRTAHPADGAAAPYPFEHEYTWMTYSEVGRAVDSIGDALREHFGVRRGQIVGIYSENCKEWAFADLAICSQGAVSVPLYATFQPGDVAKIFGKTGLEVAFCNAHALACLAEHDALLGHLKCVIGLEDTALSDAQRQAFAAHGVDYYTLAEVVELGTHAPPYRYRVTRAHDLYSVVFTSGTTGDPKGAMLLHRNALAGVSAIQSCDYFVHGLRHEVHYSYLPMAHVYERLLVLTMLCSAGRLGFLSSSIAHLMDDLGALRPTFLIGVPRVWQRIKDSVTDAVRRKGVLAAALFKLAVSATLGARESRTTTLVDWDRLVFDAIRARFGGRVRFMISGAAPVSPGVAPWLEAVLNVEFYQGYGLTETFACVVCQSAALPSPATSIGSLMAYSKCRLADVPELGYLSTDFPPRGEILIKGPQVFAGYYEDAEATAAALTADGWLRTGDIGCVRPNTTLAVIDRKKNFFKLAQGEYVAAEKLENVFGACDFVSQIWVYGDSDDSFLVAVLVPKAEHLRALAARCDDAAIADEYVNLLGAAADAAGLNGYEKIKGVVVEPHEFTIEENLLTPSSKLRRSDLKKKYAAQINRLREQIKSKLERRD